MANGECIMNVPLFDEEVDLGEISPSTFDSKRHLTCILDSRKPQRLNPGKKHTRMSVSLLNLRVVSIRPIFRRGALHNCLIVVAMRSYRGERDNPE